MAGLLTNWDIREMACIDFHSQTKRGRWNLNPEHQRDVVHDNIWKSGIINSLLKMNDIPQTYFHTITDKQGLSNFESLDGKQRCNAVIEFLDNNYKFTPNTTLLPRDQCLRGLTYLEFPPLHRQLIENAKLSIKVYPRQMSDEEISEFFLTRQVTCDDLRRKLMDSERALEKMQREFSERLAAVEQTMRSGANPAAEWRLLRLESRVNDLVRKNFFTDE